ncbi:MAG: hypothetical protein M1812_004498 [Candelaria pacifica]|nr:MAG: hypothetical protein M1812_004498 [Candelaria pacifica]
MSSLAPCPTNDTIAADQTESATLSPLLRLPGELKMKIYRYILTTPEVMVVQRGPKLAKLKLSTINPGFLRTCRQIYDDAGFILYRDNVLQFENTSAALAMCVTNKRQHIAAIESVVFALNTEANGHHIGLLLRHYKAGLRMILLQPSPRDNVHDLVRIIALFVPKILRGIAVTVLEEELIREKLVDGEVLMALIASGRVRLKLYKAKDIEQALKGVRKELK